MSERFPFFLSTPVPYTDVAMTDRFWAPRQEVVRRVSVPWVTRHMDSPLRSEPDRTESDGRYVRRGDFEAIKFLEAMAAVLGLGSDPQLEKQAKAWAARMAGDVADDGYFAFGYPSAARPEDRWKAIWYSHEDYALGHFLDAAIGLLESTGERGALEAAVRAVDNMAREVMDADRAYATGHSEIEQALTRLWGLTGERRYLDLCGWLISRHGRHERRPSYGAYAQDHLPVEDQTTIEGHAVRAAFFYTGVTEYVGATGNAAYRDALVTIFDNLVEHKMYLHGGGGITSTHNEGYSVTPDYIPPGDCYGESCSVMGNFQWAHALFRLTGEARYLDIAERMLYNAFAAALSLEGDRFFYHNVTEKHEPTLRFAWHPVPCCPPNIIKLTAKVGGYLYSTDDEGVFVNHYASSTATVAVAGGTRITQTADYPWHGEIELAIDPAAPAEFSVRLRIPGWASAPAVRVNDEPVDAAAVEGWLTLRRTWRAGDRIALDLPMTVERVTMPPAFAEYEGLVAVQRGPVVYCLEEQDTPIDIWSGGYLGANTGLAPRRDPELLGGATVIDTELTAPSPFGDRGDDDSAPATLVPYGLWDNRTPGVMRTWIRSGAVDGWSAPAEPPGA